MTDYCYKPKKITDYVKEGDYLGEIEDINYDENSEEFLIDIALFNILTEDDEFGQPKDLKGQMFRAKFNRTDIVFNNFAVNLTDDDGYLDYSKIVGADIEMSVKTPSESSSKITNLIYVGRSYL